MLLSIAPSESPCERWLEIRLGARKPPSACSPWQKEQFTRNADLPLAMVCGSGGLATADFPCEKTAGHTSAKKKSVAKINFTIRSVATRGRQVYRYLPAEWARTASIARSE